MVIVAYFSKPKNLAYIFILIMALGYKDRWAEIIILSRTTSKLSVFRSWSANIGRIDDPYRRSPHRMSDVLTDIARYSLQKIVLNTCSVLKIIKRFQAGNFIIMYTTHEECGLYVGSWPYIRTRPYMAHYFLKSKMCDVMGTCFFYKHEGRFIFKKINIQLLWVIWCFSKFDPSHHG